MAQQQNILIIEDNEAFSLLVTHYLNKNLLNVRVFVENSGQKAIESIKRLNPSIVVLDYFLENNLSAEDVINVIKSMPSQPKIILLSSLKEKEEIDKMMQLGVKAFIPKSNESFYDLVKVIHELMPENGVENPVRSSLRPYLLLSIFIAILIFIALAYYLTQAG
ncbi:MAG: hypothetical protein Kow0075_08140 [Salibacteraceae bacterium]